MSREGENMNKIMKYVIVGSFIIAMMILAVATTTTIKINRDVNIDSKVADDMTSASKDISSEIVNKGIEQINNEYQENLEIYLKIEYYRILSMKDPDKIIQATEALKNIR